MENQSRRPTEAERNSKIKESTSSRDEQIGNQRGKGHRAGTMADGTANRREEDETSIINRGAKYVE